MAGGSSDGFGCSTYFDIVVGARSRELNEVGAWSLETATGLSFIFNINIRLL